MKHFRYKLQFKSACGNWGHGNEIVTDPKAVNCKRCMKTVAFKQASNP